MKAVPRNRVVELPERALQAERIECLLKLQSCARQAGIVREPGDTAAFGRWCESTPETLALARRAAAVQEHVATMESSRLHKLSALFGLSPLERDLVALLWVLAYQRSWRIECARITGSEMADPGTATSLFDHPAAARLSSESPLLRWEIVSEEERADGTAGVILDPHILAWLDGAHELDRHLVGAGRLLAKQDVLASWPLDAVIAKARAAIALEQRIRIRVTGADERARERFAGAVAAELGIPVLAVDERFLDADSVRRFVRLQRQAFLDRCALAWRGADAARAWPTTISWFPVQFLLTGEHEPRTAGGAGVQDIDAPLTAPSSAERRILWRQSLLNAKQWRAADVDALATRYPAQLGDIESVGATSPQNITEARARLREISRSDLGPYAQRLECPYEWDDLVLPAELNNSLLDVAFEARDRHSFWEQPDVRRLYPQGRGLVALFCGTPGTGKTMAAQVIAADLGLDLWRIDLSAVISKWVGETAQNLQKILAAATDRHCVLFFDEADAVYGKRVQDVKDAQDRFANQDVSHLMVAIESFDGLVLLASNLKANIDSAFLRRIRYCLDFPRPDRAAREAIWTRLAQAFWKSSAKSLPRTLARLAEIDATGAQIKNACLSAAFVARRRSKAIDELLLVEALSRELAKDGSGLSPRELAKWQPENGHA